MPQVAPSLWLGMHTDTGVRLQICHHIFFQGYYGHTFEAFVFVPTSAWSKKREIIHTALDWIRHGSEHRKPRLMAMPARCPLEKCAALRSARGSDEVTLCCRAPR